MAKRKGKSAERPDSVRLSVTVDSKTRNEFVAFCREHGRGSYRWYVVERLIRWFLAQPWETQFRLLDPTKDSAG